MIAIDLVSANFPVLSLKDNCEKAIDLMTEFHIDDLPIVEKGKYIGTVQEEVLLEYFDEPIKNVRQVNVECAVLGSAHLFEVIKAMNNFMVTVLPVIDKEQNYLGSITMKRVIQAFSESNSLDEAGGIIVLELTNRDYSLAEISRIVETNDAKIICCYTDVYPDDQRVEVTLKVNKNNLSDIISTFERFDYTIKNTFLESDYTQELKDRYDSLMRYLNI